MKIRDLVLIASAGGVLFGASLFAESRDSWRTSSSGEEITVRGRREGSGARVADATVESSRDGRVVIRTDRGERMTLGDVPVTYRGEEYRVRDLERGDSIRIFFEPSSDGKRRARRVEVRRSVSDRHSSSDREWRVERDRRRESGRDREMDRGRRRDSSRDRNALHGRVTSVNDRNVTFLVETDDGRLVRVDGYELASRYGSSLQRIRRGDYLSLRGEFVDGGAFRAREVVDRGGNERRRVRVERRSDRTDRDRNWRDSGRLERSEERDEDKEDDDDDDDDDVDNR